MSIGESDRLLICGSRKWDNYDRIYALLKAHKPSLVIEGGARGADTMAGQAAEELGIPYLIYLANWTKWGKKAGPIRNQEMLEKGKPDEVWAFSNNIVGSPGTTDMIKRSLMAHLPVTLHSDREQWSFSSLSEFEAFLESLNSQPLGSSLGG